MEGVPVMITSFLLGLTLAVGQTDAGPPLPAAAPSAASTDGSKNGSDTNSDDKNSNGKDSDDGVHRGFFRRFLKEYCDEFSGKNKDKPEEPPAERVDSLPEPWSSPPFPTHEYQGFPLIGVPPESGRYPFMEALYGCDTPLTDCVKDSRIVFYGWVTTSGNWSTAKNSNAPTSYWVVPNRYELDQMVFRLERQVDTAQNDHVDWGFRSTAMYGMDYRYTTAGGWGSDQLLVHNSLYGWDPIEQYVDVYIPNVIDGLVIRAGRWVACPDIETQLAPDNYLGSHSILFTYDTYTQTGVMLTEKLNKQWMVQLGINAGNDMAPWFPGAVPCGYAGVRWVSKDNKDSLYTVLNQIDDAEFSHFHYDGQPAGHDNFNYLVSTWEHTFSKEVHTATEGYFMWQRDAELGGTPSLGPVKPFGGGGGDGTLLPGLSYAYGLLNYTEFGITKNDYICVRNEWWRDERGMRSGFAGRWDPLESTCRHASLSIL